MAAFSASCACECPEVQSANSVAETQQERQSSDEVEEPVDEQSEASEPEEDQVVDDVFDIDDPRDAGVRLTRLYEVLAEGNPVHDRIGWAKAGVAASRVEEICSNPELSVELDPSCDKLLLAIGSPFAQSAQILAESLEELRDVVSRREFLSHPGAHEWDSDIAEYEIPPLLLQATLAISDSIADPIGYISGFYNWKEDRDAFSQVLLSIVDAGDTTGSITSAAFAALSQEIQEWKPRSIRLSDVEIALGRQRIIEELARLGIAASD